MGVLWRGGTFVEFDNKVGVGTGNRGVRSHGRSCRAGKCVGQRKVNYRCVFEMTTQPLCSCCCYLTRVEIRDVPHPMGQLRPLHGHCWTAVWHAKQQIEALTGHQAIQTGVIQQLSRYMLSMIMYGVLNQYSALEPSKMDVSSRHTKWYGMGMGLKDESGRGSFNIKRGWVLRLC